MHLVFKIAEKASFILIFLAASITFSAAAQLEDQEFTKTVVVTGTSTIYHGNAASARETAVSSSLASAVDRVIMGLLPLDSIVSNFETINQIISDQTAEFIQDYKVLTESHTEKHYKVIVEVTVSKMLLEEKLSEVGIQVGQKVLPKILFLISEQKLDDPRPEYWWRKDWIFYRSVSEIAMAEVLAANGFTIVEHDNIIVTDDISIFFNKPELNIQEAANIGAMLQADVVIVGKAFGHKVPNVMGTDIRSFKGTITAQAFRTDSGTEIAATSQNAVAANSDEIVGCREAVSKAAALAAKHLAAQIATAWQKEEAQISKLEIMLEGTGNLANFVKFRNMLQDMPGVKEMQIKELKADQAVITVSFQGTAKALADAIILKTFESIGINIYEVSENHLRIELTTK